MDWKKACIIVNTSEERKHFESIINTFEIITKAINLFNKHKLIKSELDKIFFSSYEDLHKLGVDLLINYFRIEGLGNPTFYIETVLVYNNLVIDSQLFVSRESLKTHPHLNDIKTIKIAIDPMYREKDPSVRSDILSKQPGKVNVLVPLEDLLMGEFDVEKLLCKDIMNTAACIPKCKELPKATEISLTMVIEDFKNNDRWYWFKQGREALTKFMEIVNTEEFYRSIDLTSCRQYKKVLKAEKSDDMVEVLLSGNYCLKPVFYPRLDVVGNLVINIGDIVVSVRHNYKTMMLQGVRDLQRKYDRSKIYNS